MLSLICPWHCSLRTTETGASCLSCHLKLQTYPGNGYPCQAPFAALLRKCECLQIGGRQKGLAWKTVAQPHLPMALLSRNHRDWGFLLVLPPQTSKVAWEKACLPDSSCTPAPKMRTSADSLQPQGASLESSYSVSSAHGTSRSEAQIVELLASLATSNFKRILGTGIPARLLSHPCSENANVCR